MGGGWLSCTVSATGGELKSVTWLSEPVGGGCACTFLATGGGEECTMACRSGGCCCCVRSLPSGGGGASLADVAATGGCGGSCRTALGWLLAKGGGCSSCAGAGRALPAPARLSAGLGGGGCCCEPAAGEGEVPV